MRSCSLLLLNLAVLDKGQLDRIVIVLVAARNPLNIGAAARAMSNFGFLRLRVVNRYRLAFREAQSAVGASELLHNAEECATLADAIADCSLVVGTTAVGSRQLDHPVHRLESGARLIREYIAGDAHAAILFGSEKRGLSNEDLSYCHWLMRIPTREEHISMNLGQAVAVCLYELIRIRSRTRRSTTHRARHRRRTRPHGARSSRSPSRQRLHQARNRSRHRRESPPPDPPHESVFRRRRHPDWHVGEDAAQNTEATPTVVNISSS